MKRILFSIILVVGLTTATYAQDYNTGIGLRGGYGWGITAKHFLNQTNAIEGFLYAYPNGGFNLTGLYKFHHRAFDVDYLRWFYGFGAHIGGHSGANLVLGIDGIIGIEYTFSEAPINIGIDFNPHINLTGHTGFMPFAALSIRYVF